jgi:hypothetical protein
MLLLLLDAHSPRAYELRNHQGVLPLLPLSTAIGNDSQL